MLVIMSRSPLHSVSNQHELSRIHLIKDIPTQLYVDIFRSQPRVTSTVFIVDALMNSEFPLYAAVGYIRGIFRFVISLGRNALNCILE